MRVTGSLTQGEKRIVKALLAEKWTNQDIQALINLHRAATVNPGRIASVKKDNHQEAATREEVEFYRSKKRSYDPQTGLNLFDDERLIRSREAMLVAVQIFNSPGIKFKAGVFAMLTNVAWTYLMHEFYHRQGVDINRSDGKSFSLSQMIDRSDCPLSQGVRDNLSSMKDIRDEVEHRMLGRADSLWMSLFQACCLNYETTICE